MKANIIDRPAFMQASFPLPSESGPSHESCWSTPCPWWHSPSQPLGFLFKVSFDFVEIQWMFGATRDHQSRLVWLVLLSKWTKLKKGIKRNCEERDEAMRTCNKRLTQRLLWAHSSHSSCVVNSVNAPSGVSLTPGDTFPGLKLGLLRI